MNKQIIYVTILLIFQTGISQSTVSYIEKSEEPINFCGKLKKVKSLEGTIAKIWHNGGIYRTLNGSDNIKWPNDEIKKIAGEEYWKGFEPQIGDVGKIIFVTKSKYKETIYILKIKDYYVPVKCSYLINRESLDVTEAEQKRWDEINAYGRGDCNFKKYGFNKTWNRAGIAEINKISESFACN